MSLLDIARKSLYKYMMDQIVVSLIMGFAMGLWDIATWVYEPLLCCHRVCGWASLTLMVWNHLCSNVVYGNRLSYSPVDNVWSILFLLFMLKLLGLLTLDMNIFEASYLITLWAHGEYTQMMSRNLNHDSIFCWSDIDADVCGYLVKCFKSWPGW